MADLPWNEPLVVTAIADTVLIDSAGVVVALRSKAAEGTANALAAAARTARQADDQLDKQLGEMGGWRPCSGILNMRLLKIHDLFTAIGRRKFRDDR